MADASQVGANTVITLDPGDTITLAGVAKSSLTAADFTFFNGAAGDVITISGVPDGSTLSAGTNHGGGTWTLTYAQLAGLQLIAGEPTTTSTPAILTVEVTNPAAQAAQSVSTSETIKLTINPVPPHVAVSVTGNVAAETELEISSQTDDPDGGNDYINRIVLSGVPATGVTLSTPTTISTTGIRERSPPRSTSLRRTGHFSPSASPPIPTRPRGPAGRPRRLIRRPHRSSISLRRTPIP